MSVRRHRQADDEAELDMTPMLDVVFIMLIFFIVTSSFVKTAGISVNPPTASTAKKQENANIFIAINEKGEVWLDKRQVDIRTVRSLVSRLHAQSPDSAVVIEADKNSRTQDLIQVMNQVRLAGVSNVAVAANKP